MIDDMSKFVTYTGHCSCNCTVVRRIVVQRFNDCGSQYEVALYNAVSDHQGRQRESGTPLVVRSGFEIVDGPVVTTIQTSKGGRIVCGDCHPIQRAERHEATQIADNGMNLPDDFVGEFIIIALHLKAKVSWNRGFWERSLV